MIFICLTIVDLPDSPAPINRPINNRNQWVVLLCGALVVFGSQGRVEKCLCVWITLTWMGKVTAGRGCRRRRFPPPIISQSRLTEGGRFPISKGKYFLMGSWEFKESGYRPALPPALLIKRDSVFILFFYYRVFALNWVKYNWWPMMDIGGIGLPIGCYHHVTCLLGMWNTGAMCKWINLMVFVL